MKLLSVAIPCYNSAAYMRKCIESLLSGGEDVEILVVNDGSTDETPGIAMDYVERYPHIVSEGDRSGERRPWRSGQHRHQGSKRIIF